MFQPLIKETWNIVFEYVPDVLQSLFHGSVLQDNFTTAEFLLYFFQPANLRTGDLFAFLLEQRKYDVIEWLLFWGFRPPMAISYEKRFCFPFLKLLIQYNALTKDDIIANFLEVCRLKGACYQTRFLDLYFIQGGLDINDFVNNKEILNLIQQNTPIRIIYWLYHHKFEITGTKMDHQQAFLKAALYLNWGIMKFLQTYCHLKEVSYNDLLLLQTRMDPTHYNRLTTFLHQRNFRIIYPNKRPRLQ